MSSEIIPFTPCAECCECLTPTVEWDSRSASKSKCGNYEFEGYESVPPKVYLVKTVTNDYSLSSVQTSAHESEESCCVVSIGTVTKSSGGSIVYTTDPDDCSESPSDTPEDGPTNGSNVNTYSDSSCSSVDCAAKSNSVTDPTVYNVPWNQQAPTGFCNSPYVDDNHTDTTSTTQTVFNSRTHSSSDPGTPSCDCETYDSVECSEESTLTTELSSEYTTSALVAAALASLPAFPDAWTGTAGSYYDLTSDELTISIRGSRYRFKFKIPKVGRGTCYMVTWKERFTPDEGDPVDTEKCAIWDGMIPEGYDPADSATWPTIGEGGTTGSYFEIPIPETNGMKTVVDVKASCRGCGSGCP